MLSDLAQELQAIVAARGPALRAAATFTHGAYSRMLIERTPTRELWLLGWLPEQVTDIHDHGGVASASVVLAGNLVEEQFRVVAPGSVVFDGTALQASGALDLVDRDHVHRVRALGGPVVSLHLYDGECANRVYALAPHALELDPPAPPFGGAARWPSPALVS